MTEFYFKSELSAVAEIGRLPLLFLVLLPVIGQQVRQPNQISNFISNFKFKFQIPIYYLLFRTTIL